MEDKLLLWPLLFTTGKIKLNNPHLTHGYGKGRGPYFNNYYLNGMQNSDGTGRGYNHGYGVGFGSTDGNS
jgi:hypothetical protein